MNDNKNTSEIFNLSLLKEALDCGIISTDSVLDTLMSTKREQVRKIHTYAITPPAKVADGGRPAIRGQTEKERISRQKRKMNYWIS